MVQLNSVHSALLQCSHRCEQCVYMITYMYIVVPAICDSVQGYQFKIIYDIAINTISLRSSAISTYYIYKVSRIFHSRHSKIFEI